MADVPGHPGHPGDPHLQLLRRRLARRGRSVQLSRADGALQVAFYAPLKAPDHETPSGDRAVARLALAALHHAGHETRLMSRLRTHSREPDPEGLARWRGAAAAEIERLSREGAPPDVWLTYHPYYKAPDLIGPEMARRWRIPYLTLEASHARKRDMDHWREWQAANADALRSAAMHLCFTARDLEGLRHAPNRAGALMALDPFLDCHGRPRRPPGARSGPVRLVTVAMMRRGKRRSYVFLAQALARLAALDWTLAIIGDGPDRPAVEAAFAALPPHRVAWRGALEASGVAAAFAESDLHLWPGFEEAFGMVYLEAQAAGLPVVALNQGGVGSTMKPGETGLLIPGDDVVAYAAAVAGLISDPARRLAMGTAASRFVAQDRALPRAAATLDRALRRAITSFHV